MVKIEGEALRVQFPADRATKQAGKVVRVPLAKVEQVMVLGDITLTTPALHLLMERRIAVHYLGIGRSYGRSPPTRPRTPACAWRNMACTAICRAGLRRRAHAWPASC